MRLAVSNIAWPADKETWLADRLLDLGVRGVEIAPTKVWPQPTTVTQPQAEDYRSFWEQHGLPITSMQALLFEKPALRIFADAGQRQQAIDYLEGIIRLAGWLGAKALVFGSPKNRQIAPRSKADVWQEAVSFFRELGAMASEHDTHVCIEANPVEYGCDFITCSQEAIELVRAVAHPGFRLHLDTGGMMLSHDPALDTLCQAVPYWRHLHISEPYLAPVGSQPDLHAGPAIALRASRYPYWVSIEMKCSTDGDWYEHLKTACQFTREHYAAEELAAVA